MDFRAAPHKHQSCPTQTSELWGTTQTLELWGTTQTSELWGTTQTLELPQTLELLYTDSELPHTDFRVAPHRQEE